MDWFVHSILLSCFAVILKQPNNVQQSVFSLRNLLTQLSWPGIAVVVVLLIMSIYSIAVMLERYLTFSAAAKQSRQFVPQVSAKLRTAQLGDALELTRSYRRSHLAVVINSGLQELSFETTGKGNRQMRKAKRALKRATAVKSAELRRGLSGLATIGSTAPFVGLFGTVIGIIDAFQAMNNEQ